MTWAGAVTIPEHDHEWDRTVKAILEEIQVPIFRLSGPCFLCHKRKPWTRFVKDAFPGTCLKCRNKIKRAACAS